MRDATQRGQPGRSALDYIHEPLTGHKPESNEATQLGTEKPWYFQTWKERTDLVSREPLAFTALCVAEPAIKSKKYRTEIISDWIDKTVIGALERELSTIVAIQNHEVIVEHVFDAINAAIPHDRSVKAPHVALAALRYAQAEMALVIETMAKIKVSEAWKHRKAGAKAA
jgi:hypothetical protein